MRQPRTPPFLLLAEVCLAATAWLAVAGPPPIAARPSASPPDSSPVADPELAAFLAGLPPDNVRGTDAVRPRSAAQASAWYSVTFPTRSVLRSVETVGEGEAWAVGLADGDVPGVVARFRNGAWEVVHEREDASLHAVDMTSSDDGWAAGFDVPLRSVLLPIRDGKVGQPVFPACAALIDLHMLDAGTGWAVGNTPSGSCILRLRAGVWERVPSPGTALVVGIQITGPDTGWAVGFDGEILRWAGGAWTELESPLPADATGGYYGLSLASDSEGWAVGTDPAHALRLHGSGWSAVDTGQPFPLFAVDVVSPNLAYAAGRTGKDAPVILRHDGRDWSPVDLSAIPGPAPLIAIDLLDESTGWAAGRHATLRYGGVPAAPTATPTVVPTPTPAPVYLPRAQKR